MSSFSNILMRGHSNKVYNKTVFRIRIFGPPWSRAIYQQQKKILEKHCKQTNKKQTNSPKNSRIRHPAYGSKDLDPSVNATDPKHWTLTNFFYCRWANGCEHGCRLCKKEGKHFISFARQGLIKHLEMEHSISGAVNHIAERHLNCWSVD